MRYFISYNAWIGNDKWSGRCCINRDDPIVDIKDIEGIEKDIEDKNENFTTVLVNNWRLFED